jgi:hypothetical protein
VELSLIGMQTLFINNRVVKSEMLFSKIITIQEKGGGD